MCFLHVLGLQVAKKVALNCVVVTAASERIVLTSWRRIRWKYDTSTDSAVVYWTVLLYFMHCGCSFQNGMQSKVVVTAASERMVLTSWRSSFWRYDKATVPNPQQRDDVIHKLLVHVDAARDNSARARPSVDRVILKDESRIFSHSEAKHLLAVIVDLHMYSLFKYQMRCRFNGRLSQLRDCHADQPFDVCMFCGTVIL